VDCFGCDRMRFAGQRCPVWEAQRRLKVEADELGSKSPGFAANAVKCNGLTIVLRPLGGLDKRTCGI
jgi:hypothetical protein